MKVVSWMAGLGLLSWLMVAALPGMDSDREVLFGLAGPLVATSATWIMIDRTYRSQPAKLTGLMVAGFAAKMLFFGAYVTLMLTSLALRPTPFVTSFTVYFIALYALEARCLQRLFSKPPVGATHASPLPRVSR